MDIMEDVLKGRPPRGLKLAMETAKVLLGPCASLFGICFAVVALLASLGSKGRVISPLVVEKLRLAFWLLFWALLSGAFGLSGWRTAQVYKPARLLWSWLCFLAFVVMVVLFIGGLLWLGLLTESLIRLIA